MNARVASPGAAVSRARGRRIIVTACLVALGAAAWPVAGGNGVAGQTSARERGEPASPPDRRRELEGILRTAAPGSRAHRQALGDLVRLESAAPGGAARADSLLRAWAERYGPSGASDGPRTDGPGDYSNRSSITGRRFRTTT